MLSRDVRKLMRVYSKRINLTSTQISEKVGIEGVKTDNNHRIFCELGSVKTSSKQPPFSKANILKHRNWAKKYMKTDFSWVIFTDETWLTFDWPGKWAKDWVLTSLGVFVAKIMQQGGGSVIIWAELANQTILKPFKVDKGVKLNGVN